LFRLTGAGTILRELWSLKLKQSKEDKQMSMKMMRRLVLLVCLLLLATALAGLLWNGEGSSRTVSAIDGRDVELFGRGAYANHTIMRATTYIGADWTILLIIVPLLLVTAGMLNRFPKSLLVCSGALLIAFYYSISLSFGAAFNHFFLLYTTLFSVSGFSFGYSVYLSGKSSWRCETQSQSRSRGTAGFLFIAGVTALIWLSMIIPGMISGDFSAFIDVNTTEPTFVLDIGAVFPLFTVCGISLMKKKEFGYRFTPVLLTFYTLVGALVAVQTVVQNSYGVEIPLPQLISLVASFIAFGTISLVLNIRFMKRCITG
jgi:hypothetical protein